MTPRTPDHPSQMQSRSYKPKAPTKIWRIIRFLPLCVAVSLILSPHPSLLIVLVRYHLQTLHAPLTFAVHLLVAYTLTFLAFSSLIVCVWRDPGPVPSEEGRNDDGEETELIDALMYHEGEFSNPGKWCSTCQAPKPERTHHCSQCDRCVLKMDHHCPWLGSNCVGHRTYPAFLHFLCSVTLLSTYIAVISISALYFAFNNPLSIDEATPVHELFLASLGIIFALVVGTFFLYHVYLVSTNQTTLENISPFMLLRHLPPVPQSPTGPKLSNPPLEDELTHRQRSLVREAHESIRIYNVGFRKNWAQVFGWNRKWGWVHRLAFGGAGMGDGRTFPHNPRSDEMLLRLATELVNVDTNSPEF